MSDNLFDLPAWVSDAIPKDGEFHQIQAVRWHGGMARYFVGDREIKPPKSPESAKAGTLFSIADFEFVIGAGQHGDE